MQSRGQLTLTNANFHSFDLNHSISNSVLTSSYIVLKDGTKKKKRHVNSYMEEFLEKRRKAAEFAQSKRSISTKNYRVKLIEESKDIKDKEINVNINIKKMEETININNLKNTLPGKTKELIDNTKNINTTNNLYKYINIHKNENENGNKNDDINRQNNNNNIVKNKYNNFKRHNIVYTKKTNLSQNIGRNANISNHSFTENRYCSNNDNEDQLNILSMNGVNKDISIYNDTNKNINKLEDISPIKQSHITLNAKGGIDQTENIINEKKENTIIDKKDEENNKINKSEHFLSIMGNIIKNVNLNIDKSQPLLNNIEKDINQVNNENINNNNINKYNEYKKFLNKCENYETKIIKSEENVERKYEKLNNVKIFNDVYIGNTNKNDNNQDSVNMKEKIKKEILSLNIENSNNNTNDNNKYINFNENKIEEKKIIENNLTDELNINKKSFEEYIVEENEDKNIAYEKEEENENEEIEQERSVNRQEEENEEENEEGDNLINNNEDEENEENEDMERCEVLKDDNDKSKYLKGKKNIITEEIKEVEEGTEVNENTGEFRSGRNKNSNRNNLGLNEEEQKNSEINKIYNNDNSRNKNEKFEIFEQQNILGINKINKENDEEKIFNKEQKEEKEESFNIIKSEKKYNNLNKVEIIDLKHNKINNEKNSIDRNYNFKYSNTSKNNQQNNYKYNIINKIEYNNISNSNNENINIVNISKSNNKEKDFEEENNNNDRVNINDNLMYNEESNLNKLSDINNLNSEINESSNDAKYFNYEKNNKEKEDFISIMNKDIERLEKIRNSNYNANHESKEDESYIYEIDNFINLMREKRKTINNNIITNDINNNINKKDYIPPKNVLELKRIYKNLNNKNNVNVNTETNYNYNILQKINYNKMKLPIIKSSNLQSILNGLKKEKTYNININNININNENQIINNNFFSEKINKEINDNINNYNNIEESKYSEDIQKNDFKLFDETKFRKIKEVNLRKRNKFRNDFKFKDFETNKNLSHIYLDKVKEDLLMNISATKALNKNEIKSKWNFNKINLNSNSNIELNDSEIMPANSMKSLYNNKF